MKQRDAEIARITEAADQAARRADYMEEMLDKQNKPGLSILRLKKKLVFTIASRLLRILMEHIEVKNSLDSKL